MQEAANGIIDDEFHPKQKIDLPGDDASLVELCSILHTRINEFLNTTQQTELLKNVQEQTRRSLGVVREILQRYSVDEIALSYNGGKDCLVLLILYLTGLHAHYNRPDSTSASADGGNPFPTTLASIYHQPSHPFPEVDQFVQSSANQYHLSLSSSTRDMKAAFQEYLDKHDNVKAIFVGTRRTDPHGSKLKHFDRTDGGWPDFMRLHLVIDWHYQEIWAFLRHFDIPYCPLYDLGYTSLGGTQDTHPNPMLRTTAGADAVQFRPAFELTEDDEERLGRDK